MQTKKQTKKWGVGSVEDIFLKEKEWTRVLLTENINVNTKASNRSTEAAIKTIRSKKILCIW